MIRAALLCGCCIALAGCVATGFPTAFVPTGSVRAAATEVSVSVESEPAGAEARASSGGQTCRTPCTLRVPAQDFSVTFTLEGYQPETVPVRVVDVRSDAETGAAISVEPNPVVAELRPSAPPRVAQGATTPQTPRARPARPSTPPARATAAPARPAVAPETKGSDTPAAPPGAPWPLR
jgi:hypothetical protein